MSKQYFHSRPRGSQLGALSSRQSRIVSSRQKLDARLEANVIKIGSAEVPWPEFWGGYSVQPQRIEFWQGRQNRMHDRLAYTRSGGRWKISRLEP